MKKIILLIVALSAALILPAQGIYQLWGMTPLGADDNVGVIFNTDAAGNNFNLRHKFNDSISGAMPATTRLIEYNGRFYGMTTEGGSTNKGVIFEWDPSANSLFGVY